MQSYTKADAGAAVAMEATPVLSTYPISRHIPNTSDFPGCEPVTIKRDALDDYEERWEYWVAETETAWMVRETTTAVHEQPSQRLAHLVGVIAGVRGSPIECFGTMGLKLRNPQSELWRILRADQAVYLYPRIARLPVYGMVLGEHDAPDVLLEVDHTTDVRRLKLRLYEEWGLPEVWVEVPDRDPEPGPRRGRPSELRIHLLDDDGKYRVGGESRAFPGWTAEEIHTAMNEPELSAGTGEVLNRVGRVLGERDGTEPEDTPWLRVQLNKAHTQGRREQRSEMVDAVLRRLLGSRGISWRQLDAREFEGVPADALVDAALQCTDESDLRRRLRALNR